jgi:predicted Na+-dependent transporter
MTKLAAWLTRYWFYLALAGVFILGWTIPAIPVRLKASNVMPWLVAVAFFLNGFVLATEEVLASLRQWRPLVVAALIGFGVAPLLVYLARLAIPGGGGVYGEGFQLLAAVPTMLVSTVVLARIARADVALALYITVATNLMAIIVVPVLLRLTLSSDIDVRVGDTALNLLLTVLVPTVLGQLVHWRWPAWSARYTRPASILSQCVILGFILTGLPQQQAPVPTWAALIAIALVFHLVLFAIAAASARGLRLDRPTAHSLTFCGAQKSMAFLALLFARVFGPAIKDNPAYALAILPGLCFYLVELTLDSVIAQRWADDEGDGA